MYPSRIRALGGLLATTVGALVLGGSLAGAESAPLHAAATKNLWATVNICDTQNHPNAIGIRARAPGDGSKENIWMRFFVQYQKNGAWTNVKKGGSSAWRKIGTAEFKWREGGVTFPFDLKPGDGYLMRGLVKIEWRLHGNVLRRAQGYTSANHHAAGGGDPKGYSAATCFIAEGIGADRSLSRRPRQATRVDRSAVRRPPSTRTADRSPSGPTGPDGATPAASAP
jgi:hypothetical protein